MFIFASIHKENFMQGLQEFSKCWTTKIFHGRENVFTTYSM